MKENKKFICHFRLIAIILFCFLLLLSGCAGNRHKLVAAYADARHSDSVKILLDEYGSPDKMDSFNLSFLCAAYSSLKDYDKLFECFDTIQKKIDNGDSAIKLGYTTVSDLNVELDLMRSTAFLELGRLDEAIKAAKKGIDDAHKYKFPQNLTNYRQILGVAYARSYQPDNARRYAKDLEGNIDNESAPTRCYGYYCTSSIYNAIGDYGLALDQAEKYAECATVNPFIVKMTGFNYDANKIMISFLLGKANAEVGNIDIAKKYFDILLNIEQIPQNRGMFWIILFERGRIAESEGKLDEAIRYYAKAVDVIEETRATLNVEANKIGYVGDKQKVYAAIVSLLFRESQFVEALGYVERGKARALVDMLASKNNFSGDKLDNNQLTVLINMLDEAERKSISLAYQNVPEAKTTDARSVMLEKKAKIAQESKELLSLVSVRPISITEIQKLLPSEETLVEYYRDGDTLFTFIVTQDSVKGLKLDNRKINETVIAFRKDMLDSLNQSRGISINDANPDEVADKSNAFKSLRDNGRSLYEKIFKPLESMIKTKNITIVPDEALHYAPFNALITDDGYLLDRYAIRILPSASVLEFLKTKIGGPSGELIAFGNPDLNDSKLDLPFAQSEVMAIAKNNPKAKVLLRNQASKTAVKEFAGQFRYIHFACHGIFDSENPLESALMLASDDKNDGRLTVDDLYDMRFNADLVTLSACNTALGKISNGDDVIGLTRGFLYSGANSIVSSLWSVSDEATSILMQEFYRNMKNMDKRAALRLSQLKVKETYNAHPYFWAAFHLNGSIQ